MAKQKISSELLQSCEKKVRQKYPVADDGQETLIQLFADLEAARIHSEVDALEIYFCILLVLDLNRNLLSIKERDKVKLLELGETCLGFCQIRPVTSHHSHLYERLYQAMAGNSIVRGDAWESAVQSMLGGYLGRDARTSEEPTAWLRAQQAWMLGHLRTTKIALHTVLIGEREDASDRRQAWRLLIRAYRLSGEPDQALLQARSYLEEFADDPQCALEVEWIHQIAALQKGAEAKALHEFLGHTPWEWESFDLCLSLLWLGASPGHEFRKEAALWKTRQGKESAAGLHELGRQLISTLDALHDQSSPLQQRFETLGKRLVALQAPHDPEAALLFLACAIRWLTRIKQTAFASLLNDEYRAQSFRLSDGRSPDALGVLRDMTESLPVVVHKEAGRSQQKFYTGTTPRFLKVAQTMARCTLHLTKLYLKHRDPVVMEQQQKQIFLDFLKDFELVLGELKGPAMKIAQIMAANYFTHKDAQAIMQGIHEDAAPLPFAALKDGMERELGEPLAACFPVFDPDPIAVASIGQVYRATGRNGEDLAVKVKYPGIEEAVRSDMRLLRLIMPLSRQLIPVEHLRVVMQQFSQRFQRECDYRLESDTQMAFHQLFANDPNIRIPRVDTGLSTASILVTEFVEGTRLDQFIQTASQAELNEVAKKVIRFTAISFLKHGMQHIDPNLANFIVTPDQVAVLDFGACFEIPDDLRRLYVQIMISRLQGDYASLHEQLMQLQFFERQDMPFDLFVQKLGPAFMAPFAFDTERPFYDDDYEDITSYLLKQGLTRKIRLDPHFFFPNSGSILTEGVIARIGACINWHQLVRDILVEIGLLDAAAPEVNDSA
ncbi:ABC1 kinase family protein [Oligoflexus tunisiensis]|uniref:ABC1 kinase family protein n=1 Tax=Oligoflexus tunisiensis TaxID=708132 RepID=UPI00114D2DF7|nr:AarF/ABC1/UbiB kinase family protein [Oligoflexus tunisiensis]